MDGREKCAWAGMPIALARQGQRLPEGAANSSNISRKAQVQEGWLALLLG